MFFPVIDHFHRKYRATITTQYAGGCSIIWMVTQEPPFVETLTGSQKTPVLVIEATHSQKRRSSGQLVIGPYNSHVYSKCWNICQTKSWVKY